MEKNRRKTRIGIIASDRMDKTVVVSIVRRFKEPKYKKYVTRRLKYKAHDEVNDCRVGDRVEIEETRPLSREKRWRVVRIIERAPIL
ncbi:MAG: 30S ribosomal protein S17 [Deltaproteobacteria bacterium]|nr:MAG: 30S ribosomal protein S17 [Deltaproteobacteria bacterium]